VSTGALIYCFNTEAVKYHPTANFCVGQIKRYLGLPVTVVTDEDTQQHLRGQDDTVIVEPRTNNKRFYKNSTIPWLNLERSNALDYTPYDTTILMDSDYFVYTDNLLQCIDTDYDFLLHDRVYDLTGRHSFDFQRFSLVSMVWATVTIFKKTALTENCNLYRIDFANFRNDYAFAVALNQITHNNNNFLPARMAMLPTDTDILSIDSDSITFRYDKKIGRCEQQDVHVLNKEIPFNV
jgi:hypothetical protein